MLGEASLFLAVDPQGFQLIGTGCQVNDLPSIKYYGGTDWVFPPSDKESNPTVPIEANIGDVPLGVAELSGVTPSGILGSCG